MLLVLLFIPLRSNFYPHYSTVWIILQDIIWFAVSSCAFCTRYARNVSFRHNGGGDSRRGFQSTASIRVAPSSTTVTMTAVFRKQPAPPNSGWWYFRFCAEAICRAKPIKSMMAWYWANTGEKIVTGFPGKEVPHTWWNQTSYSKPLQDLPLLTSRVDWHSDSSNKFQWSFSALQLPVGVFQPTSILLLIDSNTWNTNLSRTTSLSDFHPHE